MKNKKILYFICLTIVLLSILGCGDKNPEQKSNFINYKTEIIEKNEYVGELEGAFLLISDGCLNKASLHESGDLILVEKIYLSEQGKYIKYKREAVLDSKDVEDIISTIIENDFFSIEESLEPYQGPTDTVSTTLEISLDENTNSITTPKKEHSERFINIINKISEVGISTKFDCILA